MKYISEKSTSVFNRIISLCLIMVLVMITFVAPIRVQAASQLSGVSTVTVSDLDTAKFPSTYTSFGGWVSNNCEIAIPIDLTSMPSGTVKVWFAIKSNISGQGTIRVTDNYNIYSSYTDTQKVSATDNSIMAWLEGGKKYYCVFTWSGLKDGEAISSNDFAVSVLYENGNSEEAIPVNDKSSPNKLTSGVTQKGFLTYNSSSDFYSFTVNNNTAVTLTYSFDGSRNKIGSANILVYDSTKFSVLKQTTVPKESANRYNEMAFDLGTLKAGTYIIEMTGLYGRTSIKYGTTSYDIQFKESKDKKTGKSVVTVSAEFPFNEILCVNEEVTDAYINSTTIWGDKYENKVDVVNGKFTAKKGGAYTVRLKGTDNKYYMAVYNTSIKDSDAPTVKGVADKKAYRSGRTIRFSDNGSIETATLNGKSIQSGIRISEEGEYNLVLIDDSKNETDITFYIDYTAPTLAGYQYGKSYKTGGFCGWSDNLSGITAVNIDGEEINVSVYSKYGVYGQGNHVVTVKDLAGNTTTCKFSINNN